MAYLADLEAAHRHGANHRAEILSSGSCGCFYCLAVFGPGEILDWVDEDEHDVGQTALCPRCGIDSVLGSKAGFPIDRDFLGRMHAHWFGRTVTADEVARRLLKS